jgi:hypothetical protein
MSVGTRAAVAAAFCLSLAAPAAAQDVKPVAQPAPAQAPAAAATPSPQAVVPDPFASIPAARPADVASVDAIVTAVYAVISGDKGVKRDWNRFRSLFYPGARMIPTGRNAKTGKINARVASPESYIEGNSAFLEGEGFHEQEISRHADSFGNIVQVFSAYEARHTLKDPAPFLRGINSMQLFNDGKRWWIMTIAWSPETAEHPLPKQYTEKQAR